MPLLHDQLQQVALQPHGEKVVERVYTFVGPSLDARPHQGDWPQDDWPQGDGPKPDRPLLLVSLGLGLH